LEGILAESNWFFKLIVNLIYKIIVLVVIVVGIVAVFFVSWFWTLLLIPMVIILGVDIISSFFKKKN